MVIRNVDFCLQYYTGLQLTNGCEDVKSSICIWIVTDGELNINQESGTGKATCHDVLYSARDSNRN
jgi:hypothetical protein